MKKWQRMTTWHRAESRVELDDRWVEGPGPWLAARKQLERYEKLLKAKCRKKKMWRATLQDVVIEFCINWKCKTFAMPEKPLWNCSDNLSTWHDLVCSRVGDFRPLHRVAATPRRDEVSSRCHGRGIFISNPQPQNLVPRIGCIHQASKDSAWYSRQSGPCSIGSNVVKKLHG